MRVFKIVLFAVGAVILVLAAIWVPVVAPQLTKLPTSLDQSVHFAGTYTGYVNRATGAPMAAPQSLPLTIDRHVKAVAGESTSADLVVNDTSTTAIGPQKSTTASQYVLNRSTSQNVKSPKAWALTPANVVDRSGSYSLGPPLGVDPAKTYPKWIDEIGKPVSLTSEHANQTIDGVTVQRWRTNLPATPIVASMVQAMHLPATMPFAAFAGQLKAKGVDLGAAFQALSPSLTAAEKASLAALIIKPIPLQYLYASSSQLLIEPATGATVDVVSTVRSYSVRSNLGPLAAGLAPILAAHPSNPVAAQLAAVTKQLTNAQARPLYTVTFHQTAASVTDTAHTAGDKANLLNVVQVWIPIGLGVVGVILIALGFIVGRRHRPGPTVSTPAQPGTHPVGSR